MIATARATDARRPPRPAGTDGNELSRGVSFIGFRQAALAKLTASGLLVVERHGRHRYYSIASADIAAALSTLERLGAPLPRPPAPRESAAIRQARLCYDHVAGGLGVGITDAMLGNGWLESSGRDYLLTEPGDRFLQRLGVDVDGARAKRRLFARACSMESAARTCRSSRRRSVPGCSNDWLEVRAPREIRVTPGGGGLPACSA